MGSIVEQTRSRKESMNLKTDKKKLSNLKKQKRLGGELTEPLQSVGQQQNL